MSNIKYIAELFQTNQWSPKLAIANNVYTRQKNIYAFSVQPLVTDETDPTNYWIAWGGTFDNPVGSGLQVYMGQFLTEVFTDTNLLATENSFYIDLENNICYLNIPQNPWRYFTAYASVYANVASTFGTAPKDENNLSDIYYDNVKVDPRMEIPSVENGLNDVISGINVYNAFSISVDNRDGMYDGMNILSYFNTPLQISKTTTNAQHIEDFNRIRQGIVNDITVAFDKMVITASDTFYVMNKEYCRKFTADEFPNIEDSTINEDIPVGWGVIQGAEPIEVDRDSADPPTWIDYIVLDKSHITSVQGMFSSDGISLTNTLTPATGIIRIEETFHAIGTVTISIGLNALVTGGTHEHGTGDKIKFTTTGALPTGITAGTVYYIISVTDTTYRLATSRANAFAGTAITTSGSQSGVHTGFHGALMEAEYATVTGKTDCSIGEIVIEALATNENISYIEGIWDITEGDAYKSICPDVGFYFSGGTTRELIEKVLKNDMAYLIQKNDGRLTLRRWGVEYVNHQIPTWQITKKPAKNFADATKYFCSTAKVLYNPFQKNGNYQMSYLNDSEEQTIFTKTRKLYQADFKTDFIELTPAIDLSNRVIDRFGTIRETVQIGLGVDTFGINLLDTVDIEIVPNGREFSQYSRWIVKKCDPGQDVLTLEGLSIFNPLTFDGIPATLDGVQFIVEVN